MEEREEMRHIIVELEMELQLQKMKNLSLSSSQGEPYGRFEDSDSKDSKVTVQNHMMKAPHQGHCQKKNPLL